MFEREIVETERGTFEVFKQGNGKPLAFPHLYSEFNTLGNTMSQMLSEHYSVYIINLRGAGNRMGPSKHIHTAWMKPFMIWKR